MNVRQGFKRIYIIGVVAAELVLVVHPLLSFISKASYDRRVEAYRLATMEFLMLLFAAAVVWVIIDWIWRGFSEPGA
ncbi:hypothetical protein BQ8794_10194 [Mesorhizobium prunaredense]|uniref:Transmembrane protein n=1 Tax=Mesorhizobium prunaredense TaxID=1631249 RepID=A0A1R3V290_9HYPH|nr:hypothetical protein [Mesorhizobium prunaredense]SIT52824.1 hypothetical protein BQ8794_10194 [Mesorhizobium prunaredense]